MRIQGKIVHNADLEGGFYGIVDQDGAKYNPVRPLPEAVCKDGLSVVAEIRPFLGFTTRMWGRNIEVISIHPL